LLLQAFALGRLDLDQCWLLRSGVNRLLNVPNEDGR
jgi:hypothetical protein